MPCCSERPQKLYQRYQQNEKIKILESLQTKWDPLSKHLRKMDYETHFIVNYYPKKRFVHIICNSNAEIGQLYRLTRSTQDFLIQDKEIRFCKLRKVSQRQFKAELQHTTGSSKLNLWFMYLKRLLGLIITQLTIYYLRSGCICLLPSCIFQVCYGLAWNIS